MTFKIMYFNATKNYNNILINFDFTLEKLRYILENIFEVGC